jgi:hypothetical protein
MALILPQLPFLNFDIIITLLINGSIHEKPNNIGAGPLIVILTDVRA